MTSYSTDLKQSRDRVVCMYVCMYVCTYVRMYVCTYVRMYVCTYGRMYVCTYVRMFVCMYLKLPIQECLHKICAAKNYKKFAESPSEICSQLKYANKTLKIIIKLNQKYQIPKYTFDKEISLVLTLRENLCPAGRLGIRSCNTWSGFW